MSVGFANVKPRVSTKCFIFIVLKPVRKKQSKSELWNRSHIVIYIEINILRL